MICCFDIMKKKTTTTTTTAYRLSLRASLDSFDVQPIRSLRHISNIGDVMCAGRLEEDYTDYMITVDSEE